MLAYLQTWTIGPKPSWASGGQQASAAESRRRCWRLGPMIMLVVGIAVPSSLLDTAATPAAASICRPRTVGCSAKAVRASVLQAMVVAALVTHAAAQSPEPSPSRLSLRRAPNREGAEQEANKLQGVPTIAPAASAAPASPDSAATASPDAAATAAAANTRYAYAAAPSAPEIAPRHRRRTHRSHRPLASTAPASPAAPVATLPPPT